MATHSSVAAKNINDYIRIKQPKMLELFALILEGELNAQHGFVAAKPADRKKSMGYTLEPDRLKDEKNRWINDKDNPRRQHVISFSINGDVNTGIALGKIGALMKEVDVLQYNDTVLYGAKDAHALIAAIRDLGQNIGVHCAAGKLNLNADYQQAIADLSKQIDRGSGRSKT